jgi:hypothetical protein
VGWGAGAPGRDLLLALASELLGLRLLVLFEALLRLLPVRRDLGLLARHVRALPIEVLPQLVQ